MTDLLGKTALVTAAGQGIGRAIAERFARDGASVIAVDRAPQGLATLSGMRTRVLDLTDEAAVAAAARDFPEVDVLVNAVGFVHSGTVLDCPPEDWRFSFSVNVDSMYFAIRHFLPAMLARGGGNIINISSVASSLKGVPNRFVYSATKAAIIGLTKSVAADFIGRGIRCNVICPGTVESPSLQDRLRATGDYEAALQAFKARQPLGRLGRPEEVAALAAYLASDEAAFTTGQAHIVDGGWAL